jgi:Leucine Rich repeat
MRPEKRRPTTKLTAEQRGRIAISRESQRMATVRMATVRIGSTSFATALATLLLCVLAGCSEGPPTKGELDAIAALQHLSGQVKTNPEGHAVSLILTGVEARDTDIAPVEELHDLKFLSLERTAIGDAGVAHLAKLADLQSLSLAGTKVTDAGLVHLAGLSSLENLDLKGLAITDRGLAQLAPITGLKHVYVSRNGPTQAGIDSLEAAIPHLHVTRQ